MPREDQPAQIEKVIEIPQIVADLVRRHTDEWWQTSSDFPDLDTSYTLREKFTREAHLESFLNTITSDLDKLPRLQSEQEGMHERLFASTRIFAKSALDLEDSQLDIIQNEGFIDAATDFIHKARQFDPTIRGEDIYQASRNVWTMNLLQYLMGFPVQLTPAIFAYSLLYPYSDNYLDDPLLTRQEKHNLNQRFARRLVGEPLEPEAPREKRIFDLIDMIEGQYPPNHYPLLYQSLLAIHHAQEKSLRLLRRDAAPFEVDVLSISIEKGGSAVLADGYLVAGTLNECEREFMFIYGFFTQLMDDLEDVQRDLQAGQMTIFSQAAQSWKLDRLTNMTFHLGTRMVNQLDSFNAPAKQPLKTMLQRGINLLLIDSAGQASRFYSRPHLRELEAYLPFRFSFLNQVRKKLTRRNLTLSTLVERLA